MQQASQGEQSPALSAGKKRILILVTTLIGIFLLAYTALFVYYTWQFKYGDPEDVKRITTQIEKSNFTLADSSKTQRQTAEKNVANYVRPHNPTFGNPASNVTVVQFIDFECPFCQAGYPAFSNVMERYAPAVTFVFKHMPLSSIHPNAMNAALASQCAHEQNKFWEYYHELFLSKELDIESLKNTAAQLGLNTTSFNTCLDSGRYTAQIQNDVLDGLELEVRGTPTYFVNQHIVEGVLDTESWNTLILEQIK